MALVEELGAAVGSLTVFRRVAAGTRRESQAAGLAFYPIVGLALGTLAAAAAWLLSSGAVGVLVLLALGGGRAPYALAAAASAALRAGGRPETLARLRATPGWVGARSPSRRWRCGSGRLRVFPRQRGRSLSSSPPCSVPGRSWSSATGVRRRTRGVPPGRSSGARGSGSSAGRAWSGSA